jgi:hypothetical protein
MNQMIYNEMSLYNIIGMIPTYMRPPYIDCTEASGCLADMKALGYHIISINLDTLDWEGKFLQNYSIILNHHPSLQLSLYQISSFYSIFQANPFRQLRKF